MKLYISKTKGILNEQTQEWVAPEEIVFENGGTLEDVLSTIEELKKENKIIKKFVTKILDTLTEVRI